MSRLDILPPDDLRTLIREWGRAQPDNPPMAEAARRLIWLGLGCALRESGGEPEGTPDESEN